jgi:hypothetical protein
MCRSANSKAPIWHNVLAKTEMRNTLVRGRWGETKYLNLLEFAKKLMEEGTNMILNAEEKRPAGEQRSMNMSRGLTICELAI